MKGTEISGDLSDSHAGLVGVAEIRRRLIHFILLFSDARTVLVYDKRVRPTRLGSAIRVPVQRTLIG